MSIWIKRMRRVCSGLAAAFTLIAGSVASQELQLEPHQELARELFRELIEINTVESEGTALAAEAMARHLLAAGFPGEDVQIVGPNDRKVNLVARLRGRDTGRAPILLLAHLDVVEALRSDWSIDPWTFTEADGYYYGRGIKKKGSCRTVTSSWLSPPTKRAARPTESNGSWRTAET